MKDITRVLKKLGLLGFLCICISFLNIEIIPWEFPFRHVSTFFLLTMSVILILYYERIMIDRSGLKRVMLGIAGLILLLNLLRGIKYGVVLKIDVLARHTWYLYYVPFLLIPNGLFFLSVLIFENEEGIIPRKWKWITGLSILLILLVLTNDLHQQVFRFHPGFQDWDSDYSYGWGFYAVIFWEYGLSIFAVFHLLFRCQITGIRNHFWVILIPFLAGIAMILLLITGHMAQYQGHNLIEMPEAYCLMVVGILECCLQLGLVPSNEEHRRIFRISSISAQILDKDSKTVFCSNQAFQLSEDQKALENGSRIGEHHMLRKKEIPGGYGIWIEDISELDELNRELYETGNKLAEEMALVRLQNELKEKQAQINQRTRIYDAIARETYDQSRTISRIVKDLKKQTDLQALERGRRQITLLATYMKRYANLKLLAEESAEISVGELAFSIMEVLRRLNRLQIPGEMLTTAEGMIVSSAALAFFSGLEQILETNLPVLKGIYLNLSSEKALDTKKTESRRGKNASEEETLSENVQCKLILEGPNTEIPSGLAEKLAAFGIQLRVDREDEELYLTVSVPGWEVER